jgi:hypothetical protein
MMQKDSLEMSKVVTNLILRSMTEMVDGGESTVNFFGKLLQRGSVKLARCEPPLDVMILRGDNQVLALLPDHRLELRVVAVDGTMKNSSEILWDSVGNKESLRGTGKAWMN